MKSKELKEQHLKRIYNLMLKMKIKDNDKYLLEFFKLPQLNCKYPHDRENQYKKNNHINKKILAQLEALENTFKINSVDEMLNAEERSILVENNEERLECYKERLKKELVKTITKFN